jgi:hypothetical protein
MQSTRSTYEYTQEEFVQRLERSVRHELGVDLETFLARHSHPNGEIPSFTEAHLVRSARLAGLLKPYS